MGYMRAAQTITLHRWNAHWTRKLFGLAEQVRDTFKGCELLMSELKTLVLEEMPLGSVLPKRSHARVTLSSEDDRELQEFGLIQAVFQENSTEILKKVLSEWQEQRGRQLEAVVLRDCYGMTEEEMLSLDLGSATVQVMSS